MRSQLTSKFRGPLGRNLSQIHFLATLMPTKRLLSRHDQLPDLISVFASSRLAGHSGKGQIQSKFSSDRVEEIAVNVASNHP